ncbi:hypothetical protein EV144_105401 [Flavobacterium sp. 270]|uniref:hypothetical protein n=1 Tax=Flavobacterium sp. 270 TaxID=2512114 RepID=UPI0010671985|nr:hypothetical protein [Flavobacterium sp. 270]TDW47377.1 hypothetical protein EV144_105401 [Flavobacterium sp. 270]
MKKQNIEDIFSSMEDFSSVPPPELWGLIEEKLDKPKKKKRAILWWSAAACLLLGLGLTSILHFNSTSGINNLNNGSLDNNKVVFENKKQDTNKNTTVSPENTIVEKSNADKTNSPVKNELDPAQKNQNKAVQTANATLKNKNNNNNLDLKSDVQSANTNQAVAEQPLTPAKANNLNAVSKNQVLNNKQKTANQAVVEQSYVPAKENTFNNASKNQTLNNKEKTANQAVAQKSDVPAKENTFNNASKNQILNNKEKTTNQAVAQKSDVPAKENTFNNASKNQILNNKEKTTNQAVAQKSDVPAKQNTFNNASKNQILNNKEKTANQAVAQQSYIPAKENTFNNTSKNQILNNKEKTANQAVAQQSYVPAKDNVFNNASKNQIVSNKKRTANQGIAEQKVVFGKESKFNSVPKNQVSNSIFEDKLVAKKSNNIAFNPISNGNQNTVNESIARQKNQNAGTEKAVASTQKENSKFIDVLSKQDSVQLAELQNLEKGIVTPEAKKENNKETKSKLKGEKWAVSVFAGVAASENYKNEKTLGNANDSKQSSTYGVKTKYKINNKWAVGSGFKINELAQSVANVSYMSAKNNAFFTSGDYYLVQNSAAPQIANNSDYVLVPNNTKEVVKSDNIQSGNLDQSLRYIEMPLEVSYSIFNKNKTSINLNTGGFVGKLISNQVALDGNSIGQNVNANNFVYGSTLSSTLQYRVYKKTNIFAEPAINYYINPLNNQSFNQFQWGLNFGLNFTF